MITVHFKTNEHGPVMILESYCDEGSELCRRVNEMFDSRGLLPNEENYNLIMKELGYNND